MVSCKSRPIKRSQLLPELRVVYDSRGLNVEVGRGHTKFVVIFLLCDDVMYGYYVTCSFNMLFLCAL